MSCLWNKDGPPWICQRCNWVYAIKGKPVLSDKPPQRLHCPKAPSLRPAAEKLGIKWKDAPHYARALVQWGAAGYPMRSQEEVQRIHEEHCGPCEHNAKGRCAKCHCNVNESRFVLWNKIKMKTETCPEEKW